MDPRATVVSTPFLYYICVLLLQMCPHTAMCANTSISVSCRVLGPFTTTYVSAYYICVRILLCVCSY